MQMQRSVVALGLVCLAGLAAADTGLKPGAAGGFWFGAETRLRLQALQLDAQPLRTGYSVAPTAYAPRAASLTGDYYFTTDLASEPPQSSGFRASTALLMRQPGISLSDVAHESRSVGTFGAPSRLALAGPAVGWVDPQQAYSISTLPYVGIGYSGMSPKSGWGFWADVGLLVQSPGNVTGLGRVLSGSQSVEDLMRELRMAPMVQLGVNYSF